MAKAAFSDRRTLLEGKLNLSLKKKLMKALIWSIALYGVKAKIGLEESRHSEARGI